MQSTGFPMSYMVIIVAAVIVSAALIFVFWRPGK